MGEFRYNPLLDDYTIVAGNRQNRPDMPKDYCAFCPGSGKVPDNYDVLKYDNDWSSMKGNPDDPLEIDSELYHTDKSFGRCEVILYSSDHNKSLWELPLDHIKKLVDLWQERYIDISKLDYVKYILTFENRGEEVGTTQPHPHGQIYGYGYMPLRARVELDNSKKYYEKHHESLILKIRDEEMRLKDRVLIENDDFVAFLPFYTDYPYGAYIVTKGELHNFSEFTEENKKNFAHILRDLLGTYDTLFDRRFPYMMAIYQSPLHQEEYKDADNYYHFNVKFFPPLRGKNSIKWNASSETALWAKTNPMVVEETAKELRNAYKRFKEKYDV